MKRVVVMFSVIALMFLGHFCPIKAQAEEKEKKDSISVDSTDPVFYDAVEDADTKGSKTGIILGVAGGVIIIGLGTYLLLKKKK
jgi:hypothetical protein